MRFPSWQEFIEKESKWERHLMQQIGKVVNSSVDKHPLLGVLFSGSLALLPPGISNIAQNIYDNATGSDKDRIDAVMHYFTKLTQMGEEVITNKIDSAGTCLSFRLR